MNFYNTTAQHSTAQHSTAQQLATTNAKRTLLNTPNKTPSHLIRGFFIAIEKIFIHVDSFNKHETFLFPYTYLTTKAF